MVLEPVRHPEALGYLRRPQRRMGLGLRRAGYGFAGLEHAAPHRRRRHDEQAGTSGRRADGRLPTALWSLYPEKIPAEYRPLAYPNLSVSHDNGASFELVTGADVPERWFDEHMMIERKDGSWWLLVRTHYGIGQAFSSDRGKSWHDIGDSGLGGPNSRFAVRRLKSGRLLLVNHQSPLPLPGEKRQTWRAREKLTAWLSDDDGRSWYGQMMIDERRASPTRISRKGATASFTASTTMNGSNAAKSCSRASRRRTLRPVRSSRRAVSRAVSSAPSPQKNNGFFRTAQEIRTIRGYIVYNHGK